jgi:hypothetical protein
MRNIRNKRKRGPPGVADAVASADSFTCVGCGRWSPGLAPGTRHRNHCPACLWSRHVDISPGDRRSGCLGAMEPVAVSVRRNGEWALVHRCVECGKVSMNRIAGDDGELALMSLAVRPLAAPPFPLDRLAPEPGG